MLLRFDAGARIGGGHASRCLNLADALRAAGARCTIATVEESLRAFPRLAGAGHAIVTLPEARDLRALTGPFDMAVVDHYGLGPDDEAELRSHARFLVAIDDLVRPHPQADAVIDQTYRREPTHYEGCLPAQARRFVGAGFCMIHPAFGAARAQSSVRGGALERIVVSFGATDPGNATGLTLRALEKFAAASGEAPAVDVVLGALSPHRAEVESALARSPLTVRLHVDASPEALARLYRDADLAIGAGGISSLERCCVGVPAIAVELNDNQTHVIAALVGAGAVVGAGPVDALDADALADRIGAIVQGDRASISRASFAVCDGDGVMRAAFALCGVARHAPYLRRMTMQDAEVTFHWQTAPGLRRHFRNSSLPSWKEHVAYIQAALANSAISLNVIVSANDEPTGILRLDRSATDETEVSILIAPESQGLGFARAALRQASLLRPHDRLRAWIAPDNLASLALFRSAGYVEQFDNWFVRAPGPIPVSSGAAR